MPWYVRNNARMPLFEALSCLTQLGDFALITECCIAKVTVIERWRSQRQSYELQALGYEAELRRGFRHPTTGRWPDKQTENIRATSNRDADR